MNCAYPEIISLRMGTKLHSPENDLMTKREEVALLNKILDKLLAFLAMVAGLLLLFITFSISYTIFTRAANLPSPVWILQFDEYSLLWITFLGTAWVLARNKHVSVDLITGRLKERTKTFLGLFHSVLGAAVCVLLLWYGSSVTWSQFQRGVTDVQAVDVPKYLILLVIPLGFFVLSLQFVRQFFLTLKKIRRGPVKKRGETGRGMKS